MTSEISKTLMVVYEGLKEIKAFIADNPEETCAYELPTMRNEMDFVDDVMNDLKEALN